MFRIRYIHFFSVAFGEKSNKLQQIEQIFLMDLKRFV